MTRLPLVLAVAGLALIAFGWWGLHTAAGQDAFDEMAGIIPLLTQLLGGILLLLGVGLTGARIWRK